MRPGPPLALLLVLSLAAASCRREGAPSLIVISLDTLRADTLYDALRANELPALGSFAARAVRFDEARSSASWTLPAHGSMFTGLYPDRHGATHIKASLAADVPTLAERLSEHGYETVAFTDGGGVHHRLGLQRGFERYDEWTSGGSRRGEPELPRGGAPDPVHGHNLFDRAIAFLDGGGGRERPLFLFLHTYAMHDYHRLDPWNLGALKREDLRSPEVYLACVLGKRRCSPDDWRVLETIYRGALDHVDEGFGRLAAALDRAGRLDTSLIVVLSDHGEGFEPERERIHHSGRLHADLVRVPLLIRAPGLSPGARSEPVSLVDLMPTILAYRGFDAPDGIDGRSFLPLLGATPGAGRRPRPHYVMEHAFGWRHGRRWRAPEPSSRPLAMAVIWDGLWFIRHDGWEEVYEVEGDPDQSRAVEPPAEKAESLRALLAQRERLRREPPRRPADAKLEEELRALGYLQ